MADEVKKDAAPEIPASEPKVSDHVSISDDGNMILSPEAEAIMEGKEPEERKPEKKPEEPAPEKDKQEPPKKEPEPKPNDTPKRKIKWQGQEVELEPDKETELLQKGFDYTQKMQALAAERDLLTTNIGIIRAVEQDPTLRQKIADHLKGAPEVKREETPKFEDPLDQLKWEIRQDVLKEVKDTVVKPLSEEQRMAAHQQTLANVRMQVQADPLYKDVQESIVEYVKGLPQSVGRNLFLQLDQDPASYLETYKQFRQKIADSKPKEEKPPEKKADELPPPVKRETRAPLLESAEKDGTEPTTKAQSDRLKDLIKRSRRGDHAATGELIELYAAQKGA